MKVLTSMILRSCWRAVFVAVIAAAIAQWWWHMWELSVLVLLMIIAGQLHDSVINWYIFRRNPEYQKDTREKKE